MLLTNLKKHSIKQKIIHFIGIGGIGMSGIAEILHNAGYKIQGSDILENYNTNRLKHYGIKIFLGHNILNLNYVSYVVTSSAIQEDNIEIQEALLRKIPIIKRFEILAELMKFKFSIAVSGSHGKTTTTSLLASVFEYEGLEPTVINGGILNKYSTNAYIGSDEYLIAEADESDETFINVPCVVSVITNIDYEHIDYYNNFDTLISAFKKFILNVPFYGAAVCCISNPIVYQLIQNITEKKNIITYGIDLQEANINAINVINNLEGSIFDVKVTLPKTSGNLILQAISIPIPGKHNILNALATIAVSLELDFGINAIRDGLKNFQGVKRRFTKICTYNGVDIIDDYAHHPVEIKATLSTAIAIAKKKSSNVIVIFQPHRYSRTSMLFEDFVQSFHGVNQLYITEIYSANERIIDNISSTLLINTIRNTKTVDKVEHIASYDDVIDILENRTSYGDILLIMGAGDISLWSNRLALEYSHKKYC